MAAGRRDHQRPLGEFLAANECDEMQGYLFSPPVPAERIAEMLLAQARTGGRT